MGRIEATVDEEGPFITDAGFCSACGAAIDLDDLAALDFQATDGGIQPGSPDGPAVHWAEGTIGCPVCGGRLWLQVSE